jgi:hypothetical protein
VLWNDVCVFGGVLVDVTVVLVFVVFPGQTLAVVESNGPTSATDLDRDAKVARFGAGDAFFTISVSHCSALGSGVAV